MTVPFLEHTSASGIPQFNHVMSPVGRLPRRHVFSLTESLTSLQQRLFKTGGRLIRHARYFILQLAESYLTPTLCRQILGRIERLAWHPT